MHLWCFDEDSNSWDTVHVSTLSWHDQENLLGYNLPNTDLLLTAGGLDGMTNVSWSSFVCLHNQIIYIDNRLTLGE